MSTTEQKRRYIPISERKGVRIAAGLGMAAFASAKAGVVFTDAGDIVSTSDGAGGVFGFSIDMDNDGTNDFAVLNQSFISSGAYYQTYSLFNFGAAYGNSIANSTTAPYGSFYAANLGAGDQIDGSLDFAAGYSDNLGNFYSDSFYNVTPFGVYGPYSTAFGPTGDWSPFGSTGFLGVQFDINGSDHFGWIEMSIDGQDLTLHGFAFCDQAGTGILAGDEGAGSASDLGSCADAPTGAPEPHTLGLLALGAAAMAGLRRRQRKLNA